VAIPEIHVNAWHIKRQGNEFIVTIGSADARTQRLIIGMNHALDFSLKIAAALKEAQAGE
jgi:hypothetical protein